MRPFLTTLPLLVSAGLLAPNAGAAQSTQRFVPVPGPIKDAGTYHVASDTWTRSGSDGLLSQEALFRNDLGPGYLNLTYESDVVHDEGRLPGFQAPLAAGSAEKGWSDVYEITGFRFSYCALSDHAVTCTLKFRNAYAPCSPPPNASPILATFELSGLPNDGCWTVAVDLRGTTLSFEMVADQGDGWDNDNDLDNFGWSLGVDNNQGDHSLDHWAGPIMAGNNNLPQTTGNGTVFKNPSMGGTGLGTEDLFWLQSISVHGECYWVGGCLPCASFRMTLFGKIPAGPTPYCSPAAANSASPSGAELRSAGSYGTALASFVVLDVPDQPGILFSGSTAMSQPFGCGTRCVGGPGIARYGPFTPAGNVLLTTIDMSMSTSPHTQYWYRDPAGAPLCGSAFNLSTALR